MARSDQSRQATGRRGRPLSAAGEFAGKIGSIVTRLTFLGVAVVAATTLVALLAERWWIAELFSHFRIQYIAAAVVLVVASFAFRRYAPAIVMLGSIAINAYAARSLLVPPVSAMDGGAGYGPALRIVSANVLSRNPDPTGLIELIREESPDLVLVIEHTEIFAESLEALHTLYPYRISSTEFGTFGIALYSRLPLADPEVVSLGATDAVSATISTGDADIHFVGVHLLPPTGSARAAERNLQLLRIGDLAAAGTDTAIVCGDFNLTPYSPYFSRLIEATRLRPAHRTRRPSWTWPAGVLPLGVPIDHCLIGSAIGVVDSAVLGDIGSDHYPLRIDITAEATDDIQDAADSGHRTHW